MDSLSYSISGLTVLAEYHQGSLIWNTQGGIYETFSASHYNAGQYSVAAPEDGGSGSGSARYTAGTPAGVLAAGSYAVVFRRHLDGTAANDLPIGSGASPTTSSGIGPYALNHNGGTGAAGASDTIAGVPTATDCLRVVDFQGNGIDGATLRLYAAADNVFSTVLGAATTGPDGRWLAPIYCSSGSYQLVTRATGDQSDIHSVVVP
jgi:hypothetical protein